MKLDPTRPAMTDGGDAGLHAQRCRSTATTTTNRTCATTPTRPTRWPSRSGTRHPEGLGPVAARRRQAAVPGRELFRLRIESLRLLRDGRRGGVPRLAGRARASACSPRCWRRATAGTASPASSSGSAPTRADLHYNSFQPVCVLCREWNSTFGGGEKVKRTLKVFNDTRYDDPVEMTWTFTVAGKPSDGGKQTFHAQAGHGRGDRHRVHAPPVVKERTPAELTLTCRRGGKEVFREVKACRVIDRGRRRQAGAGEGRTGRLRPQGDR